MACRHLARTSLTPATQATKKPRETNMNQVAEISITGRGSVSAMPDGIQINLSVESQNADYPSALAELNKRVAALLAAVTRAGVTETVITKSYDIAEVWNKQHDPEKRTFQGYTATQQMAVTIPLNMTLLGDMVRELTNSDSQPTLLMVFVIRDMDAIEKNARITAANRARAAAHDLAATAGLQLASVKSITYTAGRNNSALGLLHMESGMQFDMSPSASVTPDVINHEETVHMVWLATPQN